MGEKDNRFSYKDGITLREYIDTRLEAIEKASELAAKLLDVRLESMNEFRNALKDQSGQFVMRSECGIRKQSVDGDIRILREYKAALEGKASHLYVSITLIIALLSLFVGVVGLLIKFH
jgi:hypothetical protein